jgi:nitrite reductase/ring-hydroxylating ferredoxin subunit
VLQHTNMSSKKQSRREFLGKALGAAAIVALNPIERLYAANNIFNDIETGGIFSVDLTLSKYSALKNVNGSVAISITGAKPSTSIILTRTSATTFQAVNRACTHQSTLVSPMNATTMRIVCPAHGSQFLADGTVKIGPAVRNLPNYTTHYDAVNKPNVVTIEIPTLGIKDGQYILSPSPSLHQNFPNPVKGSTRIGFIIYGYSKVTLNVTDALGHIIAVLHDGYLSEGEYSFDFDASIFSSGTYFYHLNTDGNIATKEMIVVK